MTFVDFDTLVPIALATSLLAGLAGVLLLTLVTHGARRYLSAETRFGLWFALLVAMTFVTIGCVVSGTALLNRAPVVAVHQDGVGSRAVHASTAVAARIDVASHRPTWSPVVMLDLLWLAGFALFVVRIVVGIARLRLVKRRAAYVGKRSTRRGDVRILVSDTFPVPIAIGYRHPSILVPRSIATFERDADFENVLLHEIEHLHRYDDVTALVQNFCMSLLWFNPWAYFIENELTAEREMACDEGVVGSKSARAYVGTLWKIATAASDTVAPALSSAFHLGSHTELRLKNLLRSRASASGVQRAGLAAFTFATLVAAFVTATTAPAAVLSPNVTDYTALHLENGETLVVGGRWTNDWPVGNVQIYDANGRRIAITAMPLARWSAAATLLRDGDVLITGGMTPHGATNDVELYHLRARTIDTRAPLHFARGGHTAKLLANGTVVINGGESASGAIVSKNELYVP